MVKVEKAKGMQLLYSKKANFFKGFIIIIIIIVIIIIKIIIIIIIIID